MTPEAAIYSFLSGFGMPAYAEASVPDQDSPEWGGFPYLTYPTVIGEWNQGEVNMAVNLWFQTTYETIPNAKVRQIGDSLGIGGVTIKCDGGMLWLKKGSPWAQSVVIDGEDEGIKRRLLNISIETIAY